MQLRLQLLIVAFIMAAGSSSNASAATVTYTLDLSVNNVFKIYAEASPGDNGGIAAYSIPIIGDVLSLDHLSPAAVIATNGAPAGFTGQRPVLPANLAVTDQSGVPIHCCRPGLEQGIVD